LAFELENKPKKSIVHGETNLQMNCIKIREHYGFDCSVPLMGQEFEI
jgi:metallo-beta-lactamase family protein